jgi:hypothetical protein
VRRKPAKHDAGVIGLAVRAVIDRAFRASPQFAALRHTPDARLTPSRALTLLRQIQTFVLWDLALS